MRAAATWTWTWAWALALALAWAGAPTARGAETPTWVDAAGRALGAAPDGSTPLVTVKARAAKRGRPARTARPTRRHTRPPSRPKTTKTKVSGAALKRHPTASPTASPNEEEYEYEANREGGPGDECLSAKVLAKCRRGLQCSSNTGQCVNAVACTDACQVRRTPAACAAPASQTAVPGCACVYINGKCWLAA